MRRRPSRSTIARAAVVGAVAVAAIVVALRLSPTPAPAGAVSTQRSSWQLPALGAPGQVTLASLRGEPVVVDLFASWCTACRGELPGLAQVSASLKGRVTFVGVDSEETGDGLAMARQYGVDWWRLAADSGGADGSGLHDDLGAPGMPVAAFYDASGRLLTVVPGAMSADDLRSRVHDLFGISV